MTTRSRGNSLKKNSGLTLIELIIVLVLFSFILLSAAAIYLSAFQFFKALDLQKGQVPPLYAVEHVLRNMENANLISGGGNSIPTDSCAVSNFYSGINVRVDTESLKQNPDATIATPAITEDDRWLKYAILPRTNSTNGLFVLNVANDQASVAVTTGNSEDIMPNLNFKPCSGFVYNAAAQPTIVEMIFNVELGGEPDPASRNTYRIKRKAVAGAMTVS